MACRACQAVAVKRSVQSGCFRESASQNAHRVVAAVAMTGKLNPLRADQNVDASAIERRAEGIGMQSLTPLMIGLLVAMATIGSVWKGARIKKVVPFNGRVTRQGDFVFSERETIRLANLVSVGLASACFLGALIFCAMNRVQTQHRSS